MVHYPHPLDDITSERILQMIVYAYAYRKNPRGCDVRQFTDPLTPDEYPGSTPALRPSTGQMRTSGITR